MNLLKESNSLKTNQKIYFKFLAALLFLSLIFVQCQTSRLDLPAGFAEYKSSKNYAAVSANAVKLRVRTTKNQPVGTLEVLTSTTKLHFKTIGYKILKNEAITSKTGLAGHIFITSVQTMNGEYRYLTAFYLDNEKIHIIEAAGSKTDFEKHESELLNKVKSLTVRFF